MPNKVSIDEMAAAIADLQFSKEAAPSTIQNVMNRVGAAGNAVVDNVKGVYADMDPVSRQALIGGGIGAGVGGAAGLMRSRKERRLGDTLRGALAGGVLGGAAGGVYGYNDGSIPDAMRGGVSSVKNMLPGNEAEADVKLPDVQLPEVGNYHNPLQAGADLALQGAQAMPFSAPISTTALALTGIPKGVEAARMAGSKALGAVAGKSDVPELLKRQSPLVRAMDPEGLAGMKARAGRAWGDVKGGLSDIRSGGMKAIPGAADRMLHGTASPSILKERLPNVGRLNPDDIKGLNVIDPDLVKKHPPQSHLGTGGLPTTDRRVGPARQLNSIIGDGGLGAEPLSGFDGGSAIDDYGNYKPLTNLEQYYDNASPRNSGLLNVDNDMLTPGATGQQGRLTGALRSNLDKVIASPYLADDTRAALTRLRDMDPGVARMQNPLSQLATEAADVSARASGNVDARTRAVNRFGYLRDHLSERLGLEGDTANMLDPETLNDAMSGKLPRSMDTRIQSPQGLRRSMTNGARRFGRWARNPLLAGAGMLIEPAAYSFARNNFTDPSPGEVGLDDLRAMDAMNPSIRPSGGVK